jgi:hypothetical protein
LIFHFFSIEAAAAGVPQPHLFSAAVTESSEAFLSFPKQHPTSYLQPRAQWRIIFSTGAMAVHPSSSVTYSAPWASITPLLAEDRFHSSNRKSSSSTNITSVRSLQQFFCTVCSNSSSSVAVSQNRCSKVHEACSFCFWKQSWHNLIVLVW